MRATVASASTGTKPTIDPTTRAVRPWGSSSTTVVSQSCASSLARIAASPGRTPAPQSAHSCPSPIANSRSR